MEFKLTRYQNIFKFTRSREFFKFKFFTIVLIYSVTRWKNISMSKLLNTRQDPAFCWYFISVQKKKKEKKRIARAIDTTTLHRTRDVLPWVIATFYYSKAREKQDGNRENREKRGRREATQNKMPRIARAGKRRLSEREREKGRLNGEIERAF